MTPDLNIAAERLEAHAAALERTAAELRRQAADLRVVEPAQRFPALISIRDAVQHYGLSEWAVRQLLAEGVLGEVRVGDRRYIQTATLNALAGAA